MNINESFGNALKTVRKKRNLSQEDFSLVSSRTYLSVLERGLKSPTLEKIDSLAKTLDLHPLALLFLTYKEYGHVSTNQELLNLIQKEIENI